jgi:hypothetical protein
MEEMITDTWLEDLWVKTKRRESLKKSASSLTARTDDAPPPVNNSDSVVNDGSAFRNALTAEDEVPQIRQDLEATDPVQHVIIEAHIRKWTLNSEQAQAFRVIAHHSLENNPEQLRM